VRVYPYRPGRDVHLDLVGPEFVDLGGRRPVAATATDN
jgi:hypothetical protein